MRALPLDIGLIHFVGIGGIGMSGIAEILHNLGYKVQGSDLADSANVERLRELGIKVHIGHRADNLGNAQVVVVSSAVKPDNPEVLAARARLVPVVRRAEMLGELMRLKWSIAVGGTHGKTTTTSMVAALLDAAGLDPTVINGGIINAYGTNARLGSGDWMVVEADECDGTFLRLPATIAVVTNIDPEHLDHYGTFDALRDAFVRFVENIPFYGFAALCIDHPEVQALIPRVADRRIVTYGLGVNADVRAIEPQARPQRRRLRRPDREPRHQPVAHHRRRAPADARPAQRPERAGRHRRGARDGHRRRDDPPGAGRLRRREAPLHQDRRGARHHGDRRLRPPPGRDRRRAARRAPGLRRRRPRDRRRAAAPLHAGCSAVQSEFAPASTTPTRCWSPMSMPPARRRSRASTATRWSAGAARRPSRRPCRCMAPADLPGMIWQVARPGDLVVCLGAGNITAWAHALPGQLEQLAAEKAGPRAIANDSGTAA